MPIPAPRRHPIVRGPLLAVLALGALLAAPTPADAQTADRRQKELAEIETRLKARAEEERRLKDESKEREKEIAGLRYRMIETANSLQDAEKRIGEIEAEIARLEAEESEIAEALALERGRLGDVLAGLQSIERSRPPALLVSPGDANRAARAAMLMADAAPALEAKAAALRLMLERLASVRAGHEREKAAHARTNEEIAARRRVLAELLERKQAERDVTASLAAAAQKETAALAARASSLRELIERLERLASAITPRIKPPRPRLEAAPLATPAPTPSRPVARPSGAFTPSRPFEQARGALRPPVIGRLAGVFGAAKPEGGRFEGVRFLARHQAIVTAPYEGRVDFARPFGRIGNVVVLDVGGGYHILLIGLGAFLVEEGQQVAAGEPLGALIDPDGGEVALDMEIRKDRETVNPSLWLSRREIEGTGF